MKEKEVKLLFELIKDCKKSDREIAKILGLSQPTVTRTRTKLKKEGVIREYTVIPDWEKLGYQLAAFTFVSISGGVELIKRGRECTMNNPNIIFASCGEGMGMNSITISLHKDYSDFLKFLTSIRTYWADHLKDMQSFVVSLKRDEPLMLKPLSYSYITEKKI